MGHLITTDLFLNNFCTMSTGSKVVLNVVEILKEIFTKEVNIKIRPELIHIDRLTNLFELISLVFKL